ncbi:phosphatidate cytidylyltransferase [Thiomicrorhabdus sp. 6S2-11]|uniref:Phosphatidate cytidylyltransferase n=1 Tax=Thiomicrorhabdus marina TaxID=2818442 RepID=A0ABS3Q2T7_9GAMM|nr:phosphatidate cytidylyltransferase [Thiomicrorhabdus marina]
MLIPRIFTALILVAIVLGGLFYASGQTWLYGIIALALIALFESARLSQINHFSVQVLFAVLGSITLYFSLQYLSVLTFVLLTIIVLSTMIFVVYRYQRTQGRIGLQSRFLMLGLNFLLVLVFTNAMLQLQGKVSAGLLLLSMAIVWAMDTGAYFSGRAFGKRKLAKFVSPGKSWEGVWGGALSAFVLSLLSLYFLLPEISIQSLVGLSAMLTFIALLSVFGDLFESVLKRQANLKDSGKILPGHGGILDRIDSLLVAMPLSYLLWLWYF